MRDYIDIDPNDVQIFSAIHRILILRGAMQVEEDSSASSSLSRRLVICVHGAAVVQAQTNGVSENFHLDNPTRGLLLEAGWSLWVKERSENVVILVFEELSETISERLVH
jgi:hypothetical protein